MNGKTLGTANFLLAVSLLSLMACDRSSGPDDFGTGIRGFDPASSDLPNFDSANPPRLSETFFEIGAVGMNAIVYEAQGAGPHPTVVLLHGFPGNEQNLDLAQAIRRADWLAVWRTCRNNPPRLRRPWTAGRVRSTGRVESS